MDDPKQVENEFKDKFKKLRKTHKKNKLEILKELAKKPQFKNLAKKQILEYNKRRKQQNRYNMI
ncbi:14232_t:CDS:2 [Dentiscutata heterogama]|uniref:14232_t:CDS:1 n=1 Tax=Dentiscutata heterogama TaxID=1316150 RepID=A0ACA9M0E2_9GLOM|nr:14232_t:CDS:2 [Dentiscutata heterogama]